MITRRRLVVVGVVVLSVAYVLAGGLGPVAAEPGDGGAPEERTLIQPAAGGSYLWPYTSRGRTTGERTLAINLIVHGDDDRVRRALTEQTSLEWQLTDPANGSAPDTDEAANESSDETNGTDADEPSDGTNASAGEQRARPVAVDESVITWNDAHGSTRYTYIDAGPNGGEGAWLDEHYQVHAGAYFGSRYHIRAYTTEETNWTAVQVHQEYWDWFRLRHTVTDIRDSRNVLESDFIGQPYVSEVSREYYGVTRGKNDGWLSEITLAPGMAVALFLGVVSNQTRRAFRRETRNLLRWLRDNVRGVLLAAAIGGLYLGVRSAGVLLESVIPDLDPRTYIVVLYPTIALGLPALAFAFAQPFGATSRFERLQRIARRLGPPIDAQPAFAFAVVGLGAAFVLDFGGLGVVSVPVQLALHRIGLAFSLGLVAAGATRIDDRGNALLLVGAAGWLVGLAMPLFGYL